MAHIKNYGISGIGNDVQYGKNGGHVVWDSGSSVFRVTESDGSTLSQMRIALTPQVDSDAASKRYVDVTAQGLAVKDSARLATTDADMSQLTYNASGDGGKGTWTFTAPLIFDSVTVADGDRVLVKNQDENTAQDADNGRGNGLYVADVTGGTLTRTEDADGTPVGELRGGVFVFVAEGATQTNTGWAVSSPEGDISVGVDEITWAQFSGAGALDTDGGLKRDGDILSLDLSNLGSATITGSDTLAFFDTTAGDDAKTTVTNFINDLSILTNANGSNPLSVNTGNGLERNTSGSTTELDLDINGTSNVATVSGDEMIFHDVSNSGTNIKRTVSEFLSDHGVFTSGSTGTQLTASNGVEIDSNDIQLSINTLGTATSTQTSDIMVFDDATSPGTAIGRSVQNFINDHGIIQDSDFSSNGIAVRTASGTYANRTIQASAVAGEEGLTLTNGDGVSGNPTVGLDIAGLTLSSTTSGTDQIVIYDGTNNLRANLSDVVAGATVAWNTVSDGTTSASADTSSDTLTFTGQDGISLVVSDDPETITAELDIGNLTTTTAATGSDLFVLNDASSPTNHIARSATNILADLNIVNNLGSNGFAVQTATDTYTARSIVASVTSGEEGITITNGDGVSDNPTIGVDVTGQTALGAAPASGDEFLVYDTSAGSNKKVTMSNIASAVAAQVNDDSITDADSDTSVQVGNSDSDEIRLFSGKAGNGSQQIATFETADTTNDDEQFKFVNAEGEIQLQAGDAGGFGSGSTNDIDIRLVPGSSGQVFIGDTGAGVVQADDDNQLTVKGGNTNSGDAGDLVLEGGDGASTNASGDVIIRGGTGGSAEGSVLIQDSNSNEVMTFNGVSSAVNEFTATNSATGGSPELEVTGDDTNITMKLTPKGTGTLQVPTGYESNISADEDLVNKAYVDSAITTGAVSGSISSVTGTVDLTSATTQSIGTIPANATVVRVSFTIDTVSDAATEVDFGDATNGAAAYMDDTLNDPETLGTYITDVDLINVGGSSVTANATVTTAGTTGSGRVIIEYRNA